MSYPKVAAIQMCSTHLIDENLAHADIFIKQASDKGAKLAVLPENFALMGLHEQDKVKQKEQFKIGKIQTFLAEAARKNKIWLVGGTIPVATENEHKVRSAALLYDDRGELVARYDKIHLFDAHLSETEIHKESQYLEAGKEIIVVSTPFGKLGLAICFDVRFPDLFLSLYQLGVEIIALPSAFTYKTGDAHWELLTRARAVDTFSYVIGAGQGGTHTNGRQTYGHSLIVGPWGNVLAKKDDTKPGVIFADVDLDGLHKIRASIPIRDPRDFPSKKDKNRCSP